MIETILSIKYRINQKKIVLFIILLMLSFLFFWGIKAVNAYYNSKSTFAYLGTTVGNFNVGDADINLILYKEKNADEYIITYSIPQKGYHINYEKSGCSNNATYEYLSHIHEIRVSSYSKTDCRIYFEKLDDEDITTYILVEDESGSYSYNNKNYILANYAPEMGYEYIGYMCDNEISNTSILYDLNTKDFSFITKGKNTCYVYFDKLGVSDIRTIFLLEDIDGEYTYNDKKYSLNATIPDLGYKYNTYSCLYDNVTDISFKQEIKEFTYTTTGNNICYLYFDKIINSDIGMNFYIQKELNSNVYINVEIIPDSKNFTLNESKSNCQSSNGNNVEVKMSFENGNFILSTNDVSECEVYLDLVNES